ncbi:hypothetical protein [Paenibacillus chitinolyticus]|uniref:hypothetical protein n=1 Tax=Paenibacillus chitinolyticus TaxID=79263 RepID=UPI003D0594D4
MLNFLKSKTRLRNVGMYIAIASLVLDICIFQGVITPTDSEQYNMFIQRGLEVLVGLGVLSNPTKPTRKGFNL